MTYWTNDEIEAYLPRYLVEDIANMNDLIFKNRLTKSEKEELSTEESALRQKLIKRRTYQKWAMNNPEKQANKLAKLKEITKKKKENLGKE